MMRGPKDSAVTIADIAAFKAWWKKCHVATFTLFDIRQRDATFVPLPLSSNYKRTFKSRGTCPSAVTTPNKTALFEYKSVVTAAQLLEQERQRQATVSQDRSAADREAKRVAEAALAAAQAQLVDLQTRLTQSQGDVTAARNEATRWRTAAEEATKKANDLQTSIDGLQKNINTLTNQLAMTTSPEAAALLQAQLADLTSQLSTAQTLQAEAIAQANAAQVAASQTTIAANQAEVVVAQTQTVVDTVAAQVSELSPWYIKYKWFLVGGAVLAVGAYWYMNKQKATAVPVLAKNGLPVPTSARRPSGLRGNPSESVKREVVSVAKVVQRVAYRFEELFPDDTRLHEATVAAIDYVHGRISLSELQAAKEGAEDVEQEMMINETWVDDLHAGDVANARLAATAAWAIAAAAGERTDEEAMRLLEVAEEAASETRAIDMYGLRVNPWDHMETFVEKVERLLSSVGYRGPLAVVIDPPDPFATYDRQIFDRALNSVEKLAKARGVDTKAWIVGPEPSGVDAGRVSYTMSLACSSSPKPQAMVVLTHGVTPWPSSAPPGVKVVVGLLGDNDNRQFFHVPQWVKKSTVWIG
jgi:hypothetical protein